jgi:hypothetical protein
LPSLVVRLIPLVEAPLLHHLLLALRMSSTQKRNQLHDLQVLVPSQRHGSCALFVDLLSKDSGMETYDVLYARLIVHVHEEFLTAPGCHHIRPTLIFILQSKEILHTNTMYPFIILKTHNECCVPGGLTTSLRVMFSTASSFVISLASLSSVRRYTSGMGYCLVLSGVWATVETPLMRSPQPELTGPVSQ